MNTCAVFGHVWREVPQLLEVHVLACECGSPHTYQLLRIWQCRRCKLYYEREGENPCNPSPYDRPVDVTLYRVTYWEDSERLPLLK